MKKRMNEQIGTGVVTGDGRPYVLERIPIFLSA